jgi:hypothetical protein
MFGVTRHKHVSAVRDTKLVAEMVISEELGKDVSAVTSLCRHISTVTH